MGAHCFAAQVILALHYSPRFFGSQALGIELAAGCRWRIWTESLSS